MNQEHTAYGEDSGYHMAIPGMMGGGDTHEERGRWGGLTPEMAMLVASDALDVDKAPISEAVRTHIGEVVEVAGVELGA